MLNALASLLPLTMTNLAVQSLALSRWIDGASFDELAAYLCRSQSFPHGAVLLTGTGIVPPDDFTLHEHDVVEIEVAPIGVLTNSVVIV